METIEIIGEALLGTFCQMGEVGSYVALTLIICVLLWAIRPKGVNDLFGGL